MRWLACTMTGTSTAQHVKILFRLEQDEDGHPPVSVETLWALKVGDSTFRVVVYNHDEVPEVRETFKQLGCSTEQSHLSGLIAIDVPPSVSWDELKRVLDTGREQDRWDYEEACLARS